MSKFFHAVESAFSQPDVIVHHASWVELATFFTRDLITEYREYLSEAYRVAENDRIKKRLDQVSVAYEYSERFLDIQLTVEKYRVDKNEKYLEEAAGKWQNLVTFVRKNREVDAIEFQLYLRCVEEPKNAYHRKKWAELWPYLKKKGLVDY